MSNLTSTARPQVDFTQSGDPKFIDVQDLTTPGVEQTLFSDIVPGGKQYSLLQLTVICRQEGSFNLYQNSDIIASGRTGAAQSNVNFSWSPFRSISAGDTISLKFKEMTGKPVVDVESYLQARELTI